MRQLFVLFLLALVVSPWVIYRRNQKKKLVCKEEQEFQNETSSGEEEISRRRRDINIDPKTKEPIIYLGAGPHNSSVFIDDGDFDIVSEHLTKEELMQVKLQIMNTCNALNTNS